jgi:hypothetical protein
LVALFFAMSGFGIAAKNMITGKDIKNGSVTSKDLAEGAVKAKNLAGGAVTTDALAPGSVTGDILASGSVGPRSLAPAAVTSDAIAPEAVGTNSLKPEVPAGIIQTADGRIEGVVNNSVICANGVVVTSAPLCPVVPNRYAKAQNVTSDTVFDVGGGNDCYIRTKVPFSFIGQGSTSESAVALTPGTDIGTRAGVYTVTVNGTWEAGAGFARVLQIRKTIGSGPNAGNNQFVDQLIDAPATTGQTAQSLTAQVALDSEDTLSLQVASCGPDTGADVELDSVSLSLVQGIGRSN